MGDVACVSKQGAQTWVAFLSASLQTNGEKGSSKRACLQMGELLTDLGITLIAVGLDLRTLAFWLKSSWFFH